jgi:hypothetical protein
VRSTVSSVSPPVWSASRPGSADKDYRRCAFGSHSIPKEERFEYEHSHRQGPGWYRCSDSSRPEPASLAYEGLRARNPDADRRGSARCREVARRNRNQVGVIVLDASLDIETVTEIFFRVNTAGVPFLRPTSPCTR